MRLEQAADRGRFVIARRRSDAAIQEPQRPTPSLKAPLFRQRPSVRRKPIIAHDREVYRQRNLIERMFARLKDFRRIATRYDKLARNYLSGVVLAAATIRWT